MLQKVSGTGQDDSINEHLGEQVQQLKNPQPGKIGVVFLAVVFDLYS
jgi:hypothetical protein